MPQTEIVGRDPVDLFEQTVPFDRDIPVLSFNLNGRRWRLRVLDGRLTVNGKELDAYVGRNDATITSVNVDLAQSLRDLFACVVESSRSAA